MALIDPADLIAYIFVEEETTTTNNTVTTPSESVTVGTPPNTQVFNIPGTSYEEPSTSTTEVFRPGYVNRNYVTSIIRASNPTRTIIKLSSGKDVTVTTIIGDVLTDLTT
jgi:hypothetical protein